MTEQPLCAVCTAPLPPKGQPGGSPRKFCSSACKRRASHHKRGGGRPSTFACQGCGGAVSLTDRRSDGRLRRSDAKWCNDCLGAAHRRRIYRYGITPERYAAAHTAGCEICGATGVDLHVDHDHTCCPGGYTCGECVRGFLCGPCNRGIGVFGDDTDVLVAAAAYVLKTRDVLASSGGVPSRSS